MDKKTRKGSQRQQASQQATKIGGKRISEAAFDTEEEGSVDHLSPVFSFHDTCPNHFQLEDWQGDELKALVDTLRQFGRQKWSEVKRTHGYKIVDPKTFSQPLPSYISSDVSIVEFRVSGRARVFGYRTKRVFNIIWFDRNHEVYPMS